VHRKQNAAVLYVALVTSCFVLRYAHSDQGSSDSSYRASNSYSGQCSHDWACRYERSNTGNREGTNPDQPAKSATEYCSRSRPCCRTFGRFSMFFVSKVQNNTEISVLRNPAAFNLLFSSLPCFVSCLNRGV
jgi:hypothetical protein